MTRKAGHAFKRIFECQQSGTGPCRECPLRGPSPGYGVGNWDSEIAFVAFAPNEDRDEESAYEPESMDLEGFKHEMLHNWERVDRSEGGARWEFADIFDSILSQIQLRKEDIYFTNCIKCAASDDGYRNNEGLEHCLPHLEEELKSLEPRLIVTFGQHAASAVQRIYGKREELLPLPAIRDMHGQNWTTESGQTEILHLVHWGNRHMNMEKVRRDKGRDFTDSASKRFGMAAKEAGLGKRS